VVAHLVRLKLTLLRNGLRRSAWQIVGLAVGALYGLLALAVVVVSMALLSVQEPEWKKLRWKETHLERSEWQSRWGALVKIGFTPENDTTPKTRKH